MDEQKLLAIKELMDELVSEMEPSQDDFDARLGKPKLEAAEEIVGQDLDGDMEAGESPAHQMDVFDGSPEDKLKDRILKLKG